MKTSKKTILFQVLLCLIVVSLSRCSLGPAGQIIQIENAKVQLDFDKNTGAILGFRDLINSYEFLDTNISPGSLWELDLLQSSGVETIDMTTPSKFNYSRRNTSTLVLTWDQFSGTENKDLQITATIALDENKPLSSWKISVEGTEGKKVNRVIFPIISGIRDLDDEKLAVPTWMGALINDPRTQLSRSTRSVKKYEWSYPGLLSLQCLALYNAEKCGFYASSNDTKAYRKSFSFILDTLNSLTYQMIHYPSLDATLNSYAPAYDAIVGSFKGDWITAAEIYREWGSKQSWCSESRFKNNLVPSWLEETAIWVWNRDKSSNVLVPARELNQRLGLPVNVFWHWWHGCSYDDGFPEYVPPREGKESFVKAMSAANDEGVRAIVYMNSYQWGDSTESWKTEKASINAVKNIDGSLRSHVYNIFTGKSLTNMCMATQFWKDKYSSLSDSVVNTYKTNGVYMDQACLNIMCYDKNHGHSIGGGNYWVENFGKLTDLIRSKVSPEQQPALAGEGCGEAWIPLLDAMLTLRVSKERYAGVGSVQTIPFFQAVYHEHAITYGSYSSLIVPPYDGLWPKEFAPAEPLKPLDEMFNKQFLMEQARSFVWGMQPTIANYQSFLASERKDEVDYLQNLAKVRYEGLKYLLYGKFLRSPVIEIPEEEIKISRLSIYAGKRGESVTTFQKSVPQVYSGTWKSDDDQVGIALASISDDPFMIDFSFYANDYELSPSGEVNIIDAEGKESLSSYSDGNIQVNFMLPPKGLCIVEIIPDK